MKKLLFLAALAIALASCKKDKEEGFELEYVMNFDIPAGLNPVQAHFWEVDNISTDFISKSNLAGYTKDDVNRIHSKFLNLNLRNPSNSDYKWIERIYLYIDHDTLPQAEIGYLEFVPNNADNQLNLVPSQTDLKGYLTAETFDLVIEIHPLIFSPFTSTNSLDLTFHAFTEE